MPNTHALRTDDSTDCSSCLTSCNFARDKRNANFDHYFCHKSKVFVEVNGPLSSVKFYITFYCFYVE